MVYKVSSIIKVSKWIGRYNPGNLVSLRGIFDAKNGLLGSVISNITIPVNVLEVELYP